MRAHCIEQHKSPHTDSNDAKFIVSTAMLVLVSDTVAYSCAGLTLRNLVAKCKRATTSCDNSSLRNALLLCYGCVCGRLRATAAV
jgi:hypothetical protein